MISTVIFDMDGVIIDSEPIYFKVEQELLQELGIDFSKKEHSKYVGRSDLWQSIKDKYGLDFDPDEIQEREQNQYMTYLAESFNDEPVEGVSELIKSLNSDGYTLVLASSSPMGNIYFVLNKFGLLDFFSHKVSGDELETSKPHPEIFLEAAKMAETEPRHCLVIEDSQNGVRAAKNAGMRCVGYRNLNSGQQDLSAADWIIDHFNEFDLNKFDN